MAHFTLGKANNITGRLRRRNMKRSQILYFMISVSRKIKKKWEEESKGRVIGSDSNYKFDINYGYYMALLGLTMTVSSYCEARIQYQWLLS